MSGLPRHPPAPSSSIPPQSSQAIYPSEDDDVTWLDFLRTAGRTVPHPPRPPPPPPPPIRSDSTDRKRPHAGSSPERRNCPPRAVWTGRHPSDDDNTRTFLGSTRETAIDLTSPHRLQPHMSRDQGGSSNDLIRSSVRTNVRPTMGSHNSGGFLGRRGSDSFPPRWQPDSDVDRCPVCRTDFTFFYRKHHCRKCGRVVCAACSPHRITIPRQYIVQPPNSHSDNDRVPVSPSTSPYRGLGGGEVVRVCNPCVPDPWTPDAGPEELPRPSGDVRRREGSGQFYRPDIYRPVPPPPPFSSHRARPIPHPSGGDFSRSLPQGPSAPNWPFQEPHARPPPPPPPPSQPSRHRYTQSSGNVPLPQPPPHLIRQPASTNPPAPLQPRSPRVVREEDECPVCGSELPPGESVREAHIQECISARFSSTPSNGPSSAPPPRTSSIAPGSTTATPSTAPTAEPSRPRATSYRPRGMAIYRATEKDCLTEEGEPQECVICFEEFQPGDEMGRMECLCKFHRTCIRQWWDTKGVGSCPTHMLHED